MTGRIPLTSPRATAVAAAVGAGLVVVGVVLYGTAVVWSAAEYNANEAAGSVDLGPSAGVIWLWWIAAEALGLALLLAVVVLNLAIALRGRPSRTSESTGR